MRAILWLYTFFTVLTALLVPWLFLSFAALYVKPPDSASPVRVPSINVLAGPYSNRHSRGYLCFQVLT